LVWSVLLYGSETWFMKKADIARLEAFEMWVWQKLNEQIIRLMQKYFI